MAESMYNEHVCKFCASLFTDRSMFAQLAANDRFAEAQYRRTQDSLKSNAAFGCLMCQKLLKWFKIDTDFWNGYNLGLEEGHEQEVVFTMNLVDIGKLCLMVSVSAGMDMEGELNY